jgi:hypothetical protein
VEETHFVACTAVTLVNANGLDIEVVDWWEGELDLVLDVAAMAGSSERLGRGHGGVLPVCVNPYT